MMLILANVIGWITAHGRVILIGLALVVVIVASAVTFNRCKSKPHLDERQIQKANEAIEKHNDEKLTEILAESDTRIDNIDSTLKEAEERTEKAKQNYDGMTTDELAAEIERRKNQ